LHIYGLINQYRDELCIIDSIGYSATSTSGGSLPCFIA
jgi:hypothetical protein